MKKKLCRYFLFYQRQFKTTLRLGYLHLAKVVQVKFGEKKVILICIQTGCSSWAALKASEQLLYFFTVCFEQIAARTNKIIASLTAHGCAFKLPRRFQMLQYFEDEFASSRLISRLANTASLPNDGQK